ncbi:hypothetical protein FGO68_gene14132 [Halteria grandinella]|uniref:Uncharacterized protein n=1 Tax=Halteria grandinella TaxID=5974 RepID=A0A8J8P0B3_HALGN|nr:hypothetical protein FGO68_gene14132 [Halteria grandinella]
MNDYSKASELYKSATSNPHSTWLTKDESTQKRQSGLVPVLQLPPQQQQHHQFNRGDSGAGLFSDKSDSPRNSSGLQASPFLQRKSNQSQNQSVEGIPFQGYPQSQLMMENEDLTLRIKRCEAQKDEVLKFAEKLEQDNYRLTELNTKLQMQGKRRDGIMIQIRRQNKALKGFVREKLKNGMPLGDSGPLSMDDLEQSFEEEMQEFQVRQFEPQLPEIEGLSRTSSLVSPSLRSTTNRLMLKRNQSPTSNLEDKHCENAQLDEIQKTLLELKFTAEKQQPTVVVNNRQAQDMELLKQKVQLLEESNRALKSAQEMHKESYSKLTADYAELKKQNEQLRENNQSMKEQKEAADARVEKMTKEIEKLRQGSTGKPQQQHSFKPQNSELINQSQNFEDYKETTEFDNQLSGFFEDQTSFINEKGGGKGEFVKRESLANEFADMGSCMMDMSPMKPASSMKIIPPERVEPQVDKNAELLQQILASLAELKQGGKVDSLQQQIHESINQSHLRSISQQQPQVNPLGAENSLPDGQSDSAHNNGLIQNQVAISNHSQSNQGIAQQASQKSNSNSNSQNNSSVVELTGQTFFPQLGKPKHHPAKEDLFSRLQQLSELQSKNQNSIDLTQIQNVQKIDFEAQNEGQQFHENVSMIEEFEGFINTIPPPLPFSSPQPISTTQEKSLISQKRMTLQTSLKQSIIEVPHDEDRNSSDEDKLPQQPMSRNIGTKSSKTLAEPTSANRPVSTSQMFLMSKQMLQVLGTKKKATKKGSKGVKDSKAEIQRPGTARQVYQQQNPLTGGGTLMMRQSLIGNFLLNAQQQQQQQTSKNSSTSQSMFGSLSKSAFGMRKSIIVSDEEAQQPQHKQQW